MAAFAHALAPQSLSDSSALCTPAAWRPCTVTRRSNILTAGRQMADTGMN